MKYKIKEAIQHYNEKTGKNLNVKTLAEELDIDVAPKSVEHKVSMALAGRMQIPVKMLVAIADHLGVSVDFILGREKDIHAKYKSKLDKVCKGNEEQMERINELYNIVYE